SLHYPGCFRRRRATGNVENPGRNRCPGSPSGRTETPGTKISQGEHKNILFIAGGAFDGLEKIIARRLNTNVIGFSSGNEDKQLDKDQIFQFASHRDLKSYGLIPELLGRLPVLGYLE